MEYVAAHSLVSRPWPVSRPRHQTGGLWQWKKRSSTLSKLAQITRSLFETVDRALSEWSITKVILASTRGDTARYAMDHYKGQGVRLIVVPHQYGFGPGQRFPLELVKRAEQEGHVIHWSTMLFHQEKAWGEGPAQAVANFLRLFCQGVKVCVEILFMAGNAGLVAEGEQVIVAGTGRGADTALVMTCGTTTNLKGAHISRNLVQASVGRRVQRDVAVMINPHGDA